MAISSEVKNRLLDLVSLGLQGWATHAAIHFHSMFRDCLGQLSRKLKKKETPKRAALSEEKPDAAPTRAKAKPSGETEPPARRKRRKAEA